MALPPQHVLTGIGPHELDWHVVYNQINWEPM